MRAHNILQIALLLLPSPGMAQINTAGQISCRQEQRASVTAPTLQFVVVSAPDAIKQWKTRPVVAFAGFDAVKYGFTRAEFYRWHLPV
ncbi:MAG: hypothetical protein WBE44_08025, partial [Terriglobales bacterium]